MKIKSNFVSFSETLNLPALQTHCQIQDNANNHGGVQTHKFSLLIMGLHIFEVKLC